jgi:hypothetical protein
MALVMDNAIADLVTIVENAITHIGIGDGTTPLQSSDTLLDNEIERKQVDIFIDGNTVVAEAFWDETEANGITYTEAGSFHNNATNSINTGVLFAGGQMDIAKDETITLTVSIEITIEAVNS